MRITSLGFRTDIMLLTLQGSEVEDRGDHLVVRTPGNPEFWWGNFVLFRDIPGRCDVQRWETTFAHELPEASHRTFGVDGARGEVADCGEFAAAGYTVDVSAVMTASSVREPPHPNHDATCRALDLTDRGDRDAAIALQLALAQDLRQRAGCLPAPELELEEPVAGGRVPLGEEQVRFVLGVDVVDAPAVAADFHRLSHAGHRQRLRGRLLRAGTGHRTREHDDGDECGVRLHGRSF